ncbi:MAG: hypothetical protein JRF41_09965, partial [Deltaproteobacteria bacterium]|nr:hypothetical protein [Deltaproteobacteria bacterium]
MDIFDDTIKLIKQWFLLKKDITGLREYYAPISAKSSQVPTDEPNRTEIKTTIILKEDTRLELGHPSLGSCYGRVTLIGPDIPEIKAEIVPFAQIALVCCKSNVRDVSVKMDRDLHTSVQYDGYMVRSMPNLIWARVSKNAAFSGFSLRELGRSIIDALNHDFQDVIKSELFFVTSGKED